MIIIERSPNVPTTMAAIFAEEKSRVFGGRDGVGDGVMLEVEVVLVEDELDVGSTVSGVSSGKLTTNLSNT